MKKFVVMICLAAVAACGGPKKPSAAEAEAALRAYWANRCKGEFTVDHLSDLRVGDYVDFAGGWPVYANNKHTCREGTTSVSYDGMENAEKNVSAGFARRGAGGQVEIFLPGGIDESVKKLEADLEKSFQKAFPNQK